MSMEAAEGVIFEHDHLNAQVLSRVTPARVSEKSEEVLFLVRVISSLFLEK